MCAYIYIYIYIHTYMSTSPFSEGQRPLDEPAAVLVFFIRTVSFIYYIYGYVGASARAAPRSVFIISNREISN